MRFVIPGNPIPLARPRFAHKHVFDSQHMEKLKAGLIVRNQMKNVTPYESVPLSIEVSFVMTVPRCSEKRHAIYLDSYHIYKPDIDNLCKFVLDICNNVVYKDDCIVAKLSAQKLYGDDPRTEFTIKVLGTNNEMEKAK